MDKLQVAITHINVSVKQQIDRDTMVSCLRGGVHKKWAYHVLSFFLETPVHLMHDIVLAGTFTFEELYKAHQLWDEKGYADGETTEWIKEMYFLQMGSAHELGSARFI